MGCNSRPPLGKGGAENHHTKFRPRSANVKVVHGSGVSSRIVRLLERRKLRTNARRGQLWLAIAAMLFVVAFAVGLVNLPPINRPIRWELLAVAGLVGSPLRLLLLAAEYDASARMTGHSDVSFRESLRISVLSTAANLLPLPGSAMVRADALRRKGTPLRGAMVSIVIIAILWVATGALLIGISVVVASGSSFGLALCLGGVVALAGTYLVMRRTATSSNINRLYIRILVIESAFIVLGSVRYFLVLRGMGHSPSLSQAAALMLSGMVATMTGIFPGGLGIREVMAGVISGLVNLSPAVGVVAASIMRLSDLAVMAPATFVLLHQGGGSALRSQATPDTPFIPADEDRS